MICQTSFTLSYRGRSFRLFGPKVTNFCSIWSQRVGTFRPRSIAAIEASKLLLPAAAKPQKAFPDFSVLIFATFGVFACFFGFFGAKQSDSVLSQSVMTARTVQMSSKIENSLILHFLGLFRSHFGL